MRPKGLPRKTARDMVELARWLLNDETAIVHPEAYDAETDSCEGTFVAEARVSQAHEEGWSSRYVAVYTTDRPGVYEVETEDSGRDCDGMHRSGSRMVYIRRKKLERFYLNHDWERNRPAGRFRVRRWRGFEHGDQPHVYDQFAQAAGY